MNRNTLLLAFVLLFSFGKANAVTYYLKNNNPNNNWNDPCNWYTNPDDISGSDCMGVPGHLDAVIINGHSFITLQNHTTIGSLHMNNGYGWINGNYNFTVLGDAIVDHMAIQNNGKQYFMSDLVLEGTLAGSDSAFVAGICYFDGAAVSGGRTLVLNGGGIWRSYGIALTYGGKLVIPANSNLNITHTSGGANMSHTSGGYFYNYGTMTKSSSQSLTLGAYNIATGGAFNFLAGKTSITNNLTATNSNMYVSDGARLEFLNGDHLFYGSDVHSQGYVLAAGNLFNKSFDAGCNFTNDTLQLASGTWKFNMALSVPNLLLTGGASYFFAPGTITESFWWSGGHLYGGSQVTCYPQAHLYGTGGDRYTSCKFDFLNGVEWTDGNYIFNPGAEFNLPENTVFYINLANSSKFDRSTSTAPMGVVNTLGKVVKTGPGTASLNLYFHTVDSVFVYQGVLNLWRGTHNTSYFQIEGGTTVQCTQAGINFFHSTITGQGILRETNFNSRIDSSTTLDCHLEITGGSLTVNSNITPLSFKFSSGTLTGSGNIYCAGNFLWGNGTALIQGSGLIEVNGFTTMSGSGGRILYKELRINGGGSWTGTFSINFGGTGILRVPQGALLTLSPSTTIDNQGTQNAVCGIIVEGQLRKNTAYEFDFQGADFTNNGFVEGIGSFRTWNYAFVHPNTGALSPGLPGETGTLNWNGLFENKPTGNLVFDCLPGNGNILHDSLHFYHNLTLGGTLTVNADPNWPSDTFTVISWAGTKTGSFSNVILPTGYTLIVDDVAKKIRIGHISQAPFLVPSAPANPTKLHEEGIQAPDRSEQKSQNPEPELQMAVYPNPATTEVHVQGSEIVSADTEITLYDNTGRLCFQQMLRSGEPGACVIPVSGLTSGVYYIAMQTETGKTTKKIVVQSGR